MSCETITALTKGEKGDKGDSFVSPYTSYVCLLTQGTTGAPEPVILMNTLGVVPVWARSSEGNYTLTATGKFVYGKTVIFITNPDSAIASSEVGGDDSITIHTLDATTALSADSLLNDTSFEIRVYA